ncbi:alpha/beta hydrolase [Solibacillus sp. R5-41]|uniref:alpha/beta fold hydrolase n=1 Tax=Solibacillus sp. R5-41 TaxID=2048654 RepID=UPI000C1252D6|nr:alpha/beta hydrolase [Solibacillus sp. R5-41]ATP42463.1 alpha/beta hydrolase [Solibacillus sp. R5-41]
MDKKTCYLQMSDGHEVFVTTYIPSEKAIGHMHILHGMAEHSARYEHFAEFLCDEGYSVSMHDHRGHGATAEQNGQFGFFAEEDGFERVVRDVFEVIESLRQQLDIKSLTLFGHSMGSFIARRFIQQYSYLLDNVILSGTGAVKPLHLAGNVLAKQLVKVKGATVESPLLDKLSFGNFNNKIENAKTSFDWLSTDEEQVQKYIQDEKCGFIATTQFFADLTDGLLMLNKVSENSRIRPSLPILLVSGSEDPVGDAGKGVVQVGQQLQEAGLEKVKVYLFEGKRHEILNERNKKYSYEMIVRWLKDGK